MEHPSSPSESAPVIDRPIELSAFQAGEMRAAVRRYLGRRVSEPATADDLTQEVLVKVQARLSQVRDSRRLMGWVIQIARNTLTDHFRQARPTEEYDEAHAQADPTIPSALPPDEIQLREDLGAYIRSVVHALPPIYRDALILTEYDGLSQVELAQRLGLSISAAKSRVQRGRAMVQQTINRCCHFEVDRYGTVLDYRRRAKRCDC